MFRSICLSLIFAIGSLNQFVQGEVQRKEYGIIHIKVLNAKNNLIGGALVSIARNNKTVGNPKYTNEKGEVNFAEVEVGIYQINLEAEGYQPIMESEIEVQSGIIISLSLQMTEAITVSEDVVTIKGDSEKLIEQTNSPQNQLSSQLIKTVPLQSQNFDEALPLVPGVVRSSDGKINIKGGRENQSALLVNDADSTDPATGNFSLSIPLESIEQVKVFTNPYLPEYGKFTGGVVKVETRQGGDKWKAAVTDFFPEPRFRSGKLFGITNFSPRLHVEGPIIKNQFYISQGFEYLVDKKPVRGLASPDNEIKKRAGRSFTQLDFIVSPQQTLTTTLNFSSTNTKHIGLDFFNPQTVAPNFKTRDLMVGVVDRLNLPGGSLLETLFQYKRISARISGNGLDEMEITPTGRSGNFFYNQNRITERYQLQLINNLLPLTALGVHKVKFGVDFNFMKNSGNNFSRPVNINRQDGTLAKEIQYSTVGRLQANNTELAGFVQDQWLIRPNLNIDFGLRTEIQKAAAGINLMPRLAISYSPTTSGNTVFRAAVGLFYNRISLNTLSFFNFPRQIVTSYSANGKDIIDGPHSFDYLLASRHNGKVNTGKDFDAPRNTTVSLEFNQRVGSNILAKLAYLDSRTTNDLYVSPIVQGNREAIMLFNTGRNFYRSFEATTNIKFPLNQDLTLSYIRSRARGDLNDFGNYFGDFPDPVLRPNQFSNLPSDAPNRFLARGTFKLPQKITIAPILDIHTGFPYSVRDANQDYIGIRNSVRFPRFTSLDVAFTKELRILEKHTAQFTVSVFNITNHFNPRNVRYNVGDKEFGTFFANYRRFYRLDFAFNW